MLLDFSSQWGIIRRFDASTDGAAGYAETELATILGLMTGSVLAPCESSRESRIIVLDSGSGSRGPGGPRRGPRYSWRAAEDRVELYGEDGTALVRAVYDFLRALGARWVAPGLGGQRLPRGARLELAAATGGSRDEAAAATLALGHGAFLEDWEDQLVWAARAGYSSVLVLTTTDPLALGAAPLALYESLRQDFAALAGRAGLRIELGGVIPWPLDDSGAPPRAALGELAAKLAASYPEVSVFHVWPDELPVGGWRSAPPRRRAPSAAESLSAACTLAEELSAAGSEAALSFLARPCDGDAAAAIGAAGASLPPGLELLWAPRERSWARALGDTACALNVASLDAFKKTASAWKRAGGGRISVIERWEDGLLFKCAVPPMARAMAGDIAAYREVGAESLGVLRAGSRLPLASRPNAYLAPLLASAAPDADPTALLSDWALAAYGNAAGPMLDYWRELEEAWAIGLDLEEGETGVRDSGVGVCVAREPPADWGDPWKAGLERLAARRDRCEELFDRLRAAERELEEARSAADGDETAEAAIRSEAGEYAISGSVLELDCARLSAYHELAAGEGRAAGDVANLALSASGALKTALGRVPDGRSRREGRLVIRAFYDLELRATRRANARSGLRRTIDLWVQAARTAIAAARIRRRFEGRRR